MVLRAASTLAVFALTAAMLSADESNVQFDPRIDFAAFRTFSFRAQQVDSRRAELDNPLFLKKLATAIRRALIGKGLTETNGQPDIVVEFIVTGEEFGDVERRLIRRVPGGPVAVRRPVRITEGTLVIDIFRRGDADPVWRGVYRDDERTGSKLVNKLPDDARKLLEKYPRARR